MKLKKDDEECGAHNDNRDACIEIEKCVWLRDTKEEGKGKWVDITEYELCPWWN